MSNDRNQLPSKCSCEYLNLLEEMLKTLCLDQTLNELRETIRDYLNKVDKNFKEIFSRLETLEQMKPKEESE